MPTSSFANVRLAAGWAVAAWCLALAACSQEAAKAPVASGQAPAPTASAAASVKGVAASAVAPAPAVQTAASGSAPAADGPVMHFKANGFSPAWQAEVDGDAIRFMVPELVEPDAPLATASVKRMAYAKGVNYEGSYKGHTFTLDIHSGPCDRATTAAGQKREFHATFDFGASSYKGCADAVR